VTAVIEIGTHSVKCLRNGRDAVIITRLGNPITGSDRTLRAVRRFLRDGPAVIVGTHALRAAPNRKAVLRAWGLDVWVLTEDEEARFSHAGAVSGLGRGPFVTVDVGGGSTEIVGPRFRRSFPLGAATLRGAPRFPRLPRGRTVAVGGTAVTLAALCERRAHGARLRRSDLTHWLERLESLSVPRRCRLRGMDRGRADIMPSGLRILRAAISTPTFLVSTRGVRHGVALSLEK
jgi:exopolyphosphatase/pppGpp-phosphohydrolase